MPESAQISYFENYIEKLKAADAIKKAAEEKLLEKQANIDRNNQATNTNVAIAPQNSGSPSKEHLWHRPQWQQLIL
jgi:hypothetical protein